MGIIKKLAHLFNFNKEKEIEVSSMSREQHLEWAKQRAFKSLESDGDIVEMFNSFMSDLNKHPKLENHTGIELGIQLYYFGHLKTSKEMKKFIKDFN